MTPPKGERCWNVVEVSGPEGCYLEPEKVFR